jgi:hypothetical protein
MAPPLRSTASISSMAHQANKTMVVQLVSAAGTTPNSSSVINHQELNVAGRSVQDTIARTTPL